jgi:two-component system LytT family response regulator
MRALLVDDELLARKRLAGLLTASAGCSVVGECANVTEARAAIASLSPEVVFLDVSMPGDDGLVLARSLDPGTPPVVILVTAHARFAVEAFELQTLDYLLKPVSVPRLLQAVVRARDRLATLNHGKKSDLSKPKPRRIAIKEGPQTQYVDTRLIDWVEAAGNYMVLHAAGVNHVIRETLSALETNLPPEQFVRVSRSCVVNLDAVRSLHATKPGEYMLMLKDGKQVSVSRGIVQLRQRLPFGG